MSFGGTWKAWATHDNVVADACGDFGERVGGARRHKDNVCPSPELRACTRMGQVPRFSLRPMRGTCLDVQDGVANLLPRLQSRSDRDQRGCVADYAKTCKLTAHSSASVQTLTRPCDSCSICSTEKKCVEDFEATT